MVGLQPKSSGLVTERRFDDSSSPGNRYGLIKTDSTRIYAVKPQNFNPGEIVDLAGMYGGTINTAFKVNSVQVKGRVLSDDTLVTKQALLSPITLDVNPLTMEDPLNYAKILAEYSERPPAEFIADIPRAKWVTDYLMFGARINGYRFIGENNPVTSFTINLKNEIEDMFFDTNSHVNLSFAGGGNISIPAAILKKTPTVTIKLSRNKLNAFFYEASVGKWVTSGNFSSEYRQRCYVSSAAAYFVQNGILDFGLKTVQFLGAVITMVKSFQAFDSSKGDWFRANITDIVDLILRIGEPALAYANRQMTYSNVGGDITNNGEAGDENKVPTPKSDTSSLGKKVDYFLKVSYPVKNTVYMESQAGHSYAITPADFEKNKIVSFDVNQVFSDYNAFKSWVNTNIGDAQIVSLSGDLMVDHGMYNEYWHKMIDRGWLML